MGSVYQKDVLLSASSVGGGSIYGGSQAGAGLISAGSHSTTGGLSSSTAAVPVGRHTDNYDEDGNSIIIIPHGASDDTVGDRESTGAEQGRQIRKKHQWNLSKEDKYG